MASGKASKRKRTAQRTQVPVPRTARASSGIDRRLWVAGAVLAALLVAVLAGVLLTRDDGGDAGSGSVFPDAAEVTGVYSGLEQDGLALGDPGAPVTLYEYIDLQCPFCREFEVDALPTLVEEHVRSGRLRIEVRGLAFIGPDSERGIRAAFAAGLQDRLFQIKSLFFANQGAENAGWLSQDLIEAAGRSIPGLDVPRLVEDMESDAVDELLAEHAAEAKRRGVSSTPTIMVGATGEEPQLVQLSSPSDLAAIERAVAAAER